MAATLIRDAQAFFRELAANNSRDWWGEHKPRYDAQLKAPAEALLKKLRPYLEELTDAPISTKLFRPQRDLRFSRDKSPYHLHLRMLWRIDDPGKVQPGFFFGIDADGARAGGGVLQFDRAALDGWRAFVDLDGARLSGVITKLERDGFEFIHPPDLKRVPAPYAADHPQAVLLRRKGLGLMVAVPPEAVPAAALPKIFEKTERITRILSSIP